MAILNLKSRPVSNTPTCISNTPTDEKMSCPGPGPSRNTARPTVAGPWPWPWTIGPSPRTPSPLQTRLVTESCDKSVDKVLSDPSLWYPIHIYHHAVISNPLVAGRPLGCILGPPHTGASPETLDDPLCNGKWIDEHIFGEACL
jgi:hypothetical protein